MSKFKKGDQVICIDASDTNGLTMGKFYTIVLKDHSYKDTNIFIKNDRGRNDYFRNNRFISVIEHRNKTINEILNYE